MSTILKFKRYTTAGTAGITGADGEITVDTTKDTLVIHDGITAGGFPLATEANYFTRTATNSEISTALTAYDTTIISEGKIATAVSNLVAAAPSTLNTLKELSDALGADANYASTITTALGTKSPIASPTFTGTVTIPSGASISGFALLESPSFTGIAVAPTALKATNTAQVATTAYVKDNLDDYAVLATPTFTGIPAAPTALKATDTTQIATTAYVKANLLDYSPVASPTFTGTVTIPSGASISGFALLASPTFTGTPAAPTPASNTDTTQIATTAFSQSAIAAAVQAALPAGVITMWSGASTAIPVGWWLCDGTNTTPDLRGRFIIGASGTYAVAASGGSEDVTLTTAEMPAHSHTGTATGNGSHSHYVMNQDSVNPTTTGVILTTNYMSKTGSQATTASNYVLGGSATVANSGLSSATGTHTHPVTTESQGDGSAFSILPPYYALCYIMKHY
ncbi:hypothetical protein [Lake Baikal phage Baikal-20-5m-C28]|nr:hypothetical protein [Lake Baikal phage Baikal-20-5m-C28]